MKKSYNNLGYIIKENKTKSLILVDPGDFEISSKNIELMEMEQDCQFRYILSTHHHEKHNGMTAKFQTKWPDLKVIAGNKIIIFLN